jgi:site-specific recombinase XerD
MLIFGVFISDLPQICSKTQSGSKNSLRTYNLILERFYDFVADELDKHKLKFTNINRYFLNNYIIYLDKQKLSRRTQHLHVNIIKQFLIYILLTLI